MRRNSSPAYGYARIRVDLFQYKRRKRDRAGHFNPGTITTRLHINMGKKHGDGIHRKSPVVAMGQFH